MKSLFKNATLLLHNKAMNEWYILEKGYLGIENEIICYIDSVPPSEKYDIEKEMHGMLLIPGLYNLHTHTSMVLFRGLGSELPLDRWLNEKMFPMEARLRSNHIVLGTQLAMLEMLACGTVSFTDMYFYPEEEAQEVIKAGMKTNICQAITSFDSTISYKENPSVRASLNFFDNFHSSEDSLVKADLGIHAEYTNNKSILEEYAIDCKQRNARVHLHLSETQKEHEECKKRNSGATPTEFFEQIGILDCPTIAAHCVWVENSDIDILAKHNVTVVHNPSSNLKLGSGFMPFVKIQNKNVSIALGTDGAASNNNLNMFEEMNLTGLIHKGIMMDPTVVSAQSIFTAATIAGANAQARKNCGELAVGNRADIVAINLNSPHMVPTFDILALLIYSVQASDVVFTMVDGKILYENGEYKTIDKERIIYEVKKEMQKLI